MAISSLSEKVVSACSAIREPFIARVLPIDYQPYGILLSEGLAFCACCDLFDVDVIIESGVAAGRSTEIWAKYATRQVIAVDDCKAYGTRCLAEAARRLAKYDNIEIRVGDSNQEIPRIIEQHLEKRIGLFIDGPKGREAIELADACFKHSSNVVLAGIHDMCTQFYDHLMTSWHQEVFYSDDPTFRSSFGDLDEVDKEWRFEDGTTLGKSFPNGFVVGITING